MADLITSMFATHHPNCVDVQVLLNILLMADERWLVINKANEAQHLHQENPNGTHSFAAAIHLMEPNWAPNSGYLALLEHYERCILKGLTKGVPEQKSLNMILAVQKRPDEDPSAFLERIYQAYRKHPQTTENVWMVNMAFIGQSALDIRRKLKCLDRELRMNPFQLLDTAFKVYNAQEARMLGPQYS